MCREDVPRLDPKSAADRLAEAWEVPELDGHAAPGEWDRERRGFLTTTPGEGFEVPAGLTSSKPADPGLDRWARVGDFIEPYNYPDARTWLRGAYGVIPYHGE